MIDVEGLHKALEKAEPLFERLQALYAKLPDTRCVCEKPGVCCRFLPEMTTLEALQWIQVLRALPAGERREKLQRFVEFYFTNPVRLTRCPFLAAEGGCTIYPHRTFACRAYGMWSQKLGRSRTAESRQGKKELRAMWQRFGIELPEDVVEFEIDYCDQVEIIGPPVTDKKLMAVLQEIYNLDGAFQDLRDKFENEYHSDFSLLITALGLGMKKALLEKFAVVKECLQKGSDQRLQKALDGISDDLLES